jgi:hypothetical protein
VHDELAGVIAEVRGDDDLVSAEAVDPDLPRLLRRGGGVMDPGGQLPRNPRRVRRARADAELHEWPFVRLRSETQVDGRCGP